MTRGVCMKQITMTSNIVTRTLTLAKRMLDDAEDRERRWKGKGLQNRPRDRFGKGSSYILSIINYASPVLGITCRKCNKYIAPKERCYSKQGNNDYSVRTYYHKECVERLYQE